MKREIKFRRWHKQLQDMRYSESLSDFFYMVEIYKDQYDIMQFTGLQDSNEVDIYEGDIIKTIGYIGVVKYEPQAAQYHINWKTNDASRYMPFNVTFSDGEIYQCNYMEVIGNIYETPELI